MAEEVAPVVVVRRTHWARRLLNEIIALLLSLAILLAAGLVVIDTAPGHRFLVDRIGQLETATGMRFRIGRIEGSIFGKVKLKKVEVLDGKGVFASSPEIDLDWAPGAWLYNTLHIDSLEAEQFRLIRLPALKPTTKKGPILPGFDIHIGRLDIRRFEVGAAVAGRPSVGRVLGAADVRAGRAMVKLQSALSGGDRLALNLDAEPDRNRFDIDARVSAPAHGLIPAFLGWKRPIDLTVNGDGSWTRWNGAAQLHLSGIEAANLKLLNESGKFSLSGLVRPSPFAKGKVQRLTMPAVRVNGTATLRDRQLAGDLTLASPELRAVARGTLDLAANAYKGMKLGVDLLQPSAMFPNMRGKNVRMLWTLDGPFATANYSYRLTSPQVFFDNTGFVDVLAEGKGRLTPWPMRVPLRLRAKAISGLGDIAGGILRNLTIEGLLAVTPTMVRGDNLKLTSDKLAGQMSLLIDLATGRFDVVLSGGLKRYAIPGLGIVDVQTKLHVVPGAGGKTRVVGTAEAWVRRLDNGFFASLTGGLPHLTTNLERTEDGVLRFTNLQLYSPKLRLSGDGIRRKDGTFHIEANGRQAQYGPLKMILDGHIERPKVDLVLARPNAALDVRNMTLSLVPSAAGFDYRAAGQSRFGPFTSNGQILLPKGANAVIQVAALDISGSTAHGSIAAEPGGLRGQLAFAGGGIDGTLGFVPVGRDQRIDVALRLANASFDGSPSFRVAAAAIDGSVLLADGRTTMDGKVTARGLSSGSLSLARLTASGHLVDGSGEVRAAIAGRRGQAFEIATVAQVSPGQIRLNAAGTVDRRPLKLEQPMLLTAEDDGWRVAPTRISFGGGRATLSGKTGSNPEIHAEIASLPLQLFDIGWPGLGLDGTASGRIDYRWAGRPSGRADLKVRGLTRSGLVLTSEPIDLALVAVLNGNQAALRAVAGSGGKVIGRAQARFAPLAPGPTAAALLNAPMKLQLRYNGPAGTLWRMTGVELFDLTGPVQIGADIGGTMVNPQLRGAIRAQGARLESAVTGTVISDLALAGRFEGSRLALQSISGKTRDEGSITGSGTVDLAGGMPQADLSFDAKGARLLDRDDISATVTGPLKIKSQGRGGLISGNFRLNKGRFTLGRASAAAAVPKLNVRETGGGGTEVIEVAQLEPWRLDFTVKGSDLAVTGLGIDSRWSTDLKVGGRADAPTMTGTANLVRGEYEFAGRSFRLDRGIIRFRGESPPDPLLDIHAEAQVQGVDAAVIVRGTGLKPEIAFTSVPALPQDELLSRILFGTSITNLSAPEALQLAAAVAALNSGSSGLDPINAVRRAVGLDRLRILPADIATGQKTAISAGKYITRKLFVEVITDGQGYSATRVEYQITRWLSVLSSVSTIGRASANVRVSKDY